MGKAELTGFLLRAEVLKLFRDCLRAVRAAPTHSRGTRASTMYHKSDESLLGRCLGWRV